ncbi:hypothetical protein UPYG_G00202340 [Umbra pygmaea]|uniref:Snake toxin/toxin-like domain-containing protein n=1 Tax=Umbra pygmaea TaxID=75934 RepID=A0ABD0X2L1_UMBPY
MRTLLLTTVILLLLCSSQVLTLRCFTCDQNNPDNCKVVTECPGSSKFCRTVTIAGEIVSRSCQDTCVKDDNIQCCQQDMCDP